MGSDPFREQIATAVAALAGGNRPGAEAILRQILEKGDHPVALYLLGLAANEARRWPEGEALLRRALRLSPGEPRLHLALAQSLRAQHRPWEALELARAAWTAAPDDIPAALELARAQEETGASGEAEAGYRRILARGLEPIALVNLCRLLTGDGRAAEAQSLLEKALAQPPADRMLTAEFLHQLGLALKFQRRFEEAMARMEEAAALDPRPNRTRGLDRADLLRYLGREEKAAEIYRGLVETDPSDVAVHVLLSEMLLGQGRRDEALSSFTVAFRRRADPKVAAGKGQMLLRLNRAAEAAEAFRQALAVAPTHPAALAGLGRALEMEGEIDAAEAAHAQSVRASPEDAGVLEAFGNFLLRRDRAAAAQELAERACRLAPAAQGPVALLGLCWRALGDERDRWLNDYDRHVQIFDLEPPDGYADMADFNRALAAYLSGLHGQAQQYVTQTLRQGTQTHEDMFHNGHPLVDLLMPRLNRAVATYAQRLSAKGDHPLVSRRGKGVRYAGSWSSCLGDRGFHVNHIHRMGWISSCYYVSLPGAIEDDAGQQGWIRFGEAPAEFEGRFTPLRAIKPRPGRLVLFPSYMWHGTVPFQDAQKRITIAFDAVPA